MDAKPNRDAVPQVINGRINGRFAKGFSGCPGGSPEATRRAFNKRFLLDLAEDWQRHGREVFKRVRRESPASYLKVCAMVAMPKEVKLEHKNRLGQLSDEELDQAIAMLEEMIARKAGDRATVIDSEAEVVPGLPAPPARRRRKAERLADRTLSEAQPDSDNAPVSMLAEPSTS